MWRLLAGFDGCLREKDFLSCHLPASSAIISVSLDELNIECVLQDKGTKLSVMHTEIMSAYPVFTCLSVFEGGKYVTDFTGDGSILLSSRTRQSAFKISYTFTNKCLSVCWLSKFIRLNCILDFP